MIGTAFVLFAAASVAAASLQGVDPNTLSCDPAGQVYLNLPHFTDCDRYYTCDNGREVEMRCGSGTIFDFELQVCNHAWATRCWLRDAPGATTKPEPPPESSESSGDSSEEGWTGVDPNTLSCDPAGQIHLNLPHFTDCDKFYTCVHGKEVERPCPKGTIFDFELQVCNHPWATRCWLRDSPEATAKPDPSSSSEESSEEGSGDPEGSGEISAFGDASPAERASLLPQINAGGAVLNCVNSVSGSKQIPYRGDCQRYWRCVAAIPQAVYCTDGLFFNPATEQCDFEANVKCLTEEQEELGVEYLLYN